MLETEGREREVERESDRQGHGETETSGEFSVQINNRLINNTSGE